MTELKDFILEHFVKGMDIRYIAKELVRCKDCKYYEGGFCLRGMELNANDFCSRGERKDETKC